MLDLAGLPKNINGFRTTHTCELCGFEPKTKNKYREKQDHLVMKHFKEKIDKIFPHCRPYCCPTGDCSFTGKDKQALLRHYTGKHGILEKYLREALAEKGINYAHDTVKRKNTEYNGNKSGGKQARLSSPSCNDYISGISSNNNTNANLGGGESHCGPTSLTLTSRPNTEELRKEVEAMMASFQPLEHQVVFTLPSSSSVHSSSGVSLSGDLQCLDVIHENEIIIPCSSTLHLSQLLSYTTSSSSSGSGTQILRRPLLHSSSSSSTSNKTPLPGIRSLVSQVPLMHGASESNSSSSLPITNLSSSSSSSSNSCSSSSVSSSSSHSSTNSSSSTNILENVEVMWGTGATAGPAVIVEAANAITFIESADGTTFTAANIESIDDYLYSAPLNASEVRERQLDFCML